MVRLTPAYRKVALAKREWVTVRSRSIASAGRPKLAIWLINAPMRASDRFPVQPDVPSIGSTVPVPGRRVVIERQIRVARRQLDPGLRLRRYRPSESAEK